MPPTRLTEIPVVFYRRSGGAEPVLDWLRGLAPDDRRAIGTDLSTVQFGWPIGMPLCRPAHEGRIGVVHGFIKKTQKTPVEDLDLARRRMKEMQK